MTCIFCEIVNDRAPSTTLATWFGARVIVPLNPVTPGHVLVIPREHVTDWVERWTDGGDGSAMSTAVVLAREYAYRNQIGDCNLITSRGPAATQTVGHLHLHIVPRREGDGLALPWTGQQPLEAAAPSGDYQQKENDRA